MGHRVSILLAVLVGVMLSASVAFAISSLHTVEWLGKSAPGEYRIGYLDAVQDSILFAYGNEARMRAAANCIEPYLGLGHAIDLDVEVRVHTRLERAMRTTSASKTQAAAFIVNSLANQCQMYVNP